MKLSEEAMSKADGSFRSEIHVRTSMSGRVGSLHAGYYKCSARGTRMESE